jgi:hypothetical protein
MTRIKSVVAAVVLAAVSGALADQARAATALTAESAAVVVRGTFVIAGTKFVLPSEVVAVGSAPPAYSKKKLLSSYSKTTTLPEDTTLVVKSGTIINSAASKGQVGTQITATANALIDAASGTLTNAIVGQVLSISATNVTSSAHFTKSTSGTVSYGGKTSLTALAIDLNGFGGNQLTYTGKPVPNTVLYKSTDGSVIVYLNRQVTGAGVPGAHGTSTPPKSFEVDAIDLHLTNAEAFGEVPVSGDFYVGTSYAN